MSYDFLIRAFPGTKVASLLPFLGDAFLMAGVNNPDRVRMFIAQAAHECQRFTVFRENTNYSANGLAKTWPNRYSQFYIDKGTGEKVYTYNPNDLAMSLHRKPILIANTTYANRNGNGPIESGDGWDFRGGGCGMTTGRANYYAVDDALGLDGQLMDNTDLITEPYYAVMSFAVFWTDNKLNRFADKRDVKGARKVINGGTIGLADVVANYNTLKKFI